MPALAVSVGGAGSSNGEYFFGVGKVQDDTPITFGDGDDSTVSYSTVQSSGATLLWGLGSSGNSLIFTTQANNAKNHDHAGQTNPTIFIHSAIDPDSDNTQWVSLTHDQTDGVFDLGTGLFKFKGGGEFDLEATESVALDAFTADHTDTNGVLGVTTETATVGVPGILSSLTLTGDVGFASAIKGSATGFSSGGTSGNATLAFLAELAGDNDDTSHMYVAYGATAFNNNGGTSMATGVLIGTGYDDALNASSGDILFQDYSPVIATTRIVAGDGDDLTIHAADGLASAAENRNGAVLQLSGGAKANSGNDGYVKVGAGVTNPDTMTATDDDLFVIGQVEIDGMLYADGGITGVVSSGGLTLSGDVTSTTTAVDWDLLDNDASALSFDAAGKTGILELVTTDASEGVNASGFMNVTGTVTGGTLTDGTASISAGALSGVTTLTASGLISGGGITIDGVTTYTPSSDQSLLAATTLTVADGITRVVGNGGAVTLTSTPHITDGNDGECVKIQGTDDTNTVTFQDESALANSGMQLSGGEDFTLGKGDMLEVCYDSDEDKWYENSRSDN